jgi:hypothetical protein
MTTDPTFRLYSPDLYDCFLDLSVNDFSLKNVYPNEKYPFNEAREPAQTRCR